MPTSVHIPKGLLDTLDRRARALHLSRNRLIVQAIERDLAGSSGWSPGFFERLGDPDPDTARDVDELLGAIQKARTSKPPRRF
jgi:hypothetical protein